jgi:DNA-binding NtrC family response regulator
MHAEPAFHIGMSHDRSRPTAIRELRSQLIGSSDPIHAIVEEIEYASRSDATVLITGERGVGKNVVARLIHEQSHRRKSSLITIDCARVPDTHLEPAMFGHAGSARADTMGCLEQAHGGTLFIDEIGDLTLRMQALLLQFLEDSQIHGSNGIRSVVDVRIIAVSSRNLLGQIAADTFLEDLYYRLNIIHIPIPPLRERREDIPVLFSSFVRLYCREHFVPEPAMSEDLIAQLISYDWPGNVRELKTAAERMVLESHSAVTSTDVERVISGSSVPPDETQS